MHERQCLGLGCRIPFFTAPMPFAGRQFLQPHLCHLDRLSTDMRRLSCTKRVVERGHGQVASLLLSSKQKAPFKLVEEGKKRKITVTLCNTVLGLFLLNMTTRKQSSLSCYLESVLIRSYLLNETAASAATRRLLRILTCFIVLYPYWEPPSSQQLEEILQAGRAAGRLVVNHRAARRLVK